MGIYQFGIHRYCYEMSKDIYEIRLENARSLMRAEKLGPTAMGGRLDKSPNLISRMMGKNPTKTIGSRIARDIETAFNKPKGWMDQKHYEDSSTRGTFALEINGPEIGYAVNPESSDRPIITPADLTPIVLYDDISDLDPEKYVFLPVYDVKLAAGNGHINYSEAMKKKLPFIREWADKKCLSDGNAVIVYAVGESMEPNINDGDIMVVNTDLTQIESGRVYAIRAGNEVLVKRVERLINGGLLLKSDNNMHSDQTLSRQELIEGIAQIIGRVVWRAGSM